MIEHFIQYIECRKYDDIVIFDIGARDCLQSIEFYHMFPNSKIYAFECNANTINICKENIQPYSDRITLIEGAVCDYDGNITFYPINQEKTITTWKDGNPGASSLFKSNGNYTIEHYVQDEVVTNCHRLDTIITKYGIPKVDILWMDLQGAELLALKGLGNYINTVKYIHTEVSYKEMYSGQVMFEELNEFILSNHFRLKNTLTGLGWQEDVIYEKNDSIFDIVIPIGPNDRDIIEKQIEYTKQNIIGYRKIYIISYDPTIQIEGCITINETMYFPFSINTVISLHGKLDKNGWYLQQLLKLYAGIVIPGILDKYLIIDADTFFIKPTVFIKDNRCLYNYSKEYHIPYFEHMFLLNSDFIRANKEMSGICHHMIMETKYVKEIINIVEKQHNDTFYNIFLKKVAKPNESSASEYEIYFNYMLNNHIDKIEIRYIKWCNINNISYIEEENFKNKNYQYISLHWYLR